MAEEIQSYADRQLGMWAGGFDSEAKDRLNKIYAALEAAIPQEEKEKRKREREDFLASVKKVGATPFSDESEGPNVAWVIDEAEKRGVCTSDEADYLRTHFVNESNGLSLVL